MPRWYMWHRWRSMRACACSRSPAVESHAGAHMRSAPPHARGQMRDWMFALSTCSPHCDSDSPRMSGESIGAELFQKFIQLWGVRGRGAGVRGAAAAHPTRGAAAAHPTPPYILSVSAQK